VVIALPGRLSAAATMLMNLSFGHWGETLYQT
jgi:hypothetical protein